MIDLITGLPGNCKTLYTIAWVRDWAKKDSRAVFYSGIPLSDQGKEALGWQEIDAEKWMEAPPNSIVIIDECQKVFRNRSLGTIPGKHVTELETHRHKGIDLVFITQHPSLIDPAIRRLTGRHRHMVRIWGTEASTVHEWGSVRDNCDKPAQRKDSEKQKWWFDKSVYPLYKSAEVHTVKRTIPMRVKMLMFVPVLLGLIGWYVYQYIDRKMHPEAAAAASVSPGRTASGQVQGAQPAPAKPADTFDPVLDAKRYVFAQTPRVEQLQHTAPKYDELTKPTAVPMPAACVYNGKRCQCYSQQGTKIEVVYNMCLDIAHNGYFEEFKRDGEERRSESVKVLNRESGSLPLSGADTTHRPYVVLGDGDGYGVLGRRAGGAL